MKKIFLIVLIWILSGYHTAIYSQIPCIPNPEIGGAYLHPAALPFAMEGYYYSQVLTFRVPRDTFVTYQTIQVPATIDSARVLFIGGAPSGFSYNCNTPTCTWPGGTLGCALLEGMIDTAMNMVGEYRIRVFIGSWVRAAATDFYRIDSSSSYIFRVLAFNGGTEIVPYQKLSVYPNPTTGKLHIDLRDVDTDGNRIVVFDMQGKTIFVQEFDKPSSFLHTYTLDLSSYHRGMYQVMLQSGDEVKMARVALH
jgi:hypothetical protein